MSKGWFWRGNVAAYDFRVGKERYRGTLAIRKDSGLDKDGKTPSQKADEEVMALKVQLQQKMTVSEVWSQMKRRLIGDHALPVSAKNVVEVFFQKSLTSAGDRRKKLYKLRITEFCDWVNNRHKEIADISMVTPEIALEYIVHVRSQQGSTATKNDKLLTVKMLFSTLGREYGILDNPFAEIKRMPKEQCDRKIFTPEQVQIILDNSTGWLQQLFVTAFSTFQREGDCCLILKDWIDLDNNYIRFPYTRKTGVPISLPMFPRFRKLVEEALANEDSESAYLFPELARIYTANQHVISKAAKTFFDDHGIKGHTEEVKGYQKKMSVLDIHSIRHTAAVMAILSGVPVNIVMKATGHKTFAIFQKYIDHVTEEDKARYFRQMDQAYYSQRQISVHSQRPLAERVKKIVLRLTPENLDRNRTRLLALLNRL